MNDWSLLRAIAADCNRGASIRAIVESQLTDEATAVAALRRLADAGLIRERDVRGDPACGERDATYRISAKGMGVLLNRVML